MSRRQERLCRVVNVIDVTGCTLSKVPERGNQQMFGNAPSEQHPNEHPTLGVVGKLL